MSETPRYDVFIYEIKTRRIDAMIGEDLRSEEDSPNYLGMKIKCQTES